MNPDTKHTANSARKPTWWTESLEVSWGKVKAAVIADWDKAVGAGKKLEQAIAEEALAFGHGARAAYDKSQVWGGELEEKLKADWKEAGRDVEGAWDDVKDAVKHGWERAAAALKPPAAIPPVSANAKERSPKAL